MVARSEMEQGAFARAASHGAGRIARSIRDLILIARVLSELSEAFIRTLKFELFSFKLEISDFYVYSSNVSHWAL